MRLCGVVGGGAGGPGALADDIPGVDDAREPPQDGQADVDEEVGAAAGFEEDGDGGEEEREEVQEDVRGGGGGAGHCCGGLGSWWL